MPRYFRTLVVGWQQSRGGWRKRDRDGVAEGRAGVDTWAAHSHTEVLPLKLRSAGPFHSNGIRTARVIQRPLAWVPKAGGWHQFLAVITKRGKGFVGRSNKEFQNSWPFQCTRRLLDGGAEDSGEEEDEVEAEAEEEEGEEDEDDRWKEEQKNPNYLSCCEWKKVIIVLRKKRRRRKFQIFCRHLVKCHIPGMR